MITQSRLRELLTYCPRAGYFYWQVSRGKAKQGDKAGCICPTTGYRQISLDGRLYSAAHLAWFWMRGSWSALEIDHRDGVRDNNKWRNLREASSRMNKGNACKPSHNTSGFKGASFHKASGRYTAQIHINRKKKHLGMFSTVEEAYAAYTEAAKQYFGEFARAA